MSTMKVLVELYASCRFNTQTLNLSSTSCCVWLLAKTLWNCQFPIYIPNVRRNTEKKNKLQTVERLIQFSYCNSSNKRLLNFETALETAFEGGANYRDTLISKLGKWIILNVKRMKKFFQTISKNFKLRMKHKYSLSINQMSTKYQQILKKP